MNGKGLRAGGRLLKTIAFFSVLLSSVKPVDAFAYQGIMTPIQNVICGIYGIFRYIAPTLAALVFIAAAVQWVASRDDAGKRKAARDIMVHAIIGLILIGIANYIVTTIGGVKGCKYTGLPE